MLRSLLARLKQNLGLKVIALVAAAGLWLYVMNTENPIRRETHAESVVAVNTPAGLGVARLRPESLKVLFTGRLSGLSRAQLDGVKVVADLVGSRAGRNEVAVRVQGLPDRVSVASMDRDTVQVWLEPIVTRQASIGVVCTGDPAEGFALGGTPTAQPAVAAVSGPESLVSRVTRLVARVDLTGLETRQTLDVAPVARDADGERVAGVQLVPATVRVTVAVMAASTRELPVRAKIGGLLPGRHVTSLWVGPSVVELRGPPSALASVSEVQTESLDVSHLDGAQEFRAALRLPDGTWLPEDERTVIVRVTVGSARETAPPRRQPSGETEPLPTEPPEPAAGDAVVPPAQPVAEPPRGTETPHAQPPAPRSAGPRPGATAPETEGHHQPGSREEVKHPEETPSGPR
jgi:YbbR domain-containing protein